MTDILSGLRLVGLPLGAFEGLRRWRYRRQATAHRRNAIAELEALDDRVLQDIGVNRCSIPDLVDAKLQAEAGAGAATTEPRPSFGARPCAQPC
jgi:uncharacterized protein YjiS (DUF1127 family)